MVIIIYTINHLQNMGSNSSKPVKKTFKHLCVKPSPNDFTSKHLDVNSMTDDELRREKCLIEDKLKKRQKTLIIFPSFNDLINSETTVIETEWKLGTITYPVSISIPILKELNHGLVLLLTRIDESIFSIFYGGGDLSGSNHTRFSNYLDKRYNEVYRTGMVGKYKEKFEFFGEFVLDYINELGIDATSFSPLKIECRYLRICLKLTQNGKYEL